MLLVKDGTLAGAVDNGKSGNCTVCEATVGQNIREYGDGGD
jgi:hypothetical protein